ncbi:ankyrin repeat domain-containing protein 66-like [Rhopilema esculentum]|uniref:ankyrin repeat domain-containing protein 66-like n=1 Tax=Rhopilema esculentum TaxID=499914 RepID=UPI0031DA873D|eukprot:gene7860-13738_t
MQDPTELHEAASLGNKKLLDKLLADGQYDVDSEDWTYERRTPLHVAIESGKLNCVRTLLVSGADAGAKTKSGMTPVHMAAEQDNIKILQILLEYDAPIDQEDESGATPLDIAKTYGNKKCEQFLAEALRALREKRNSEQPLNDPSNENNNSLNKKM